MILNRTLLSVILFFTAIFSKAQSKVNWADSIFSLLSKDASQSLIQTRMFGDTLLQIFNQKNEICKWVKTKLCISLYQNHLGDYKSSLQCLNEASSRFNPAICKEIPLLPDIYLSYASLYYHLKETKKQDEYVQKGIECWQKQWVDKEILIKLYELEGDILKNFNDKLKFYLLAYQTAIESRNEKMQEYLLITLGEFLANEGKKKQSISYLYQALQLAIKRQSYKSLGSIYNNLAGLSENNQQIKIYLDSAYYYAQLSGDIGDMQACRQNRALLYYMNGDYKNGYDELWEAMFLKDSLYNINKINAFADMEQKYEAEKKNIKIKLLEREKSIANLQALRNKTLSIGLGSGLLMIVFVAISFYSQNKKKQKLNSQLTIEKRKSDDLLLNILPSEIAEELKQKGFSEAKLYNNVTVIFTDFVNFTGISEKLSPTELVQEIHKNFTRFDAIMGQYGIEKIKTIGDAYLAVCGLPNESSDHAIRTIRAALAIQESVTQGENKFNIRIGVHTGSVVAGIVGVKKYAYDIWGDTVNTASRMESNSEPGKINISGTTYELIKNEFSTVYRGKLEVKGKGEMDMYFVNSG